MILRLIEIDDTVQRTKLNFLSFWLQPLRFSERSTLPNCGQVTGCRVMLGKRHQRQAPMMES